MVVDSQPQTVVVDQQQVTYQPSPQQQQQFVLQDGSVEFKQPESHQVYYMEEMQDSSCHGEVLVEQPVRQPIVLNHQIQQTQVRNQVVTQKSPAAVVLTARQPIGTHSPIRPPLQVSFFQSS